MSFTELFSFIESQDKAILKSMAIPNKYLDNIKDHSGSYVTAKMQEIHIRDIQKAQQIYFNKIFDRFINYLHITYFSDLYIKEALKCLISQLKGNKTPKPIRRKLKKFISSFRSKDDKNKIRKLWKKLKNKK
jgi:translation initiation factor 2 beta subunit (eIF-2beta)/eIF-5